MGLPIKLNMKPLYGFVSVTVLSFETVGETLGDIIIDGVSVKPVIILVVRDKV